MIKGSDEDEFFYHTGFIVLLLVDSFMYFEDSEDYWAYSSNKKNFWKVLKFLIGNGKSL